ncbi:uncharacterized protein K452DRAFT_285051 [Aplosporella prunicola CBS 121167]|uniref:Uncharacterized protein n=1 Tax=Aplosporella prunicola CBS 121167 TaxID=1176127 RepID=A0A6A6BKT4_9PEZI|nr:uncharacterized protein K452DRAFT_285051 [Aplosporella prunicola CBS 121167]KAF2144730.1 hypothetical protein K452DRAFT_285051 [Aplosporella prunicola CBS 121167]
MAVYSARCIVQYVQSNPNPTQRPTNNIASCFKTIHALSISISTPSATPLPLLTPPSLLLFSSHYSFPIRPSRFPFPAATRSPASQFPVSPTPGSPYIRGPYRARAIALG